MNDTARIFSSETKDYMQAFELFLQHTNQKTNLYRWLETTVNGLPKKGVYIDVGPGEGGFTKRLAPLFNKTIAIEPNPYLLSQLQHALPQAITLNQTILAANPQEQADFILCSHVLYYIEQALWLANIERLVSWLAPKGLLVIVLQDRNTDCMQMLQHFFGHHYNLFGLLDELRARLSAAHEIHFEVDPAQIKADNFAAIYTITEFILNLVAIKTAPNKQEVEKYIGNHFIRDQSYIISCDQDLLQIRRK